ncbi:Phenylalanyl-tRNA synthetase beta subunit [[Mycoplasma] cavipharyngis]|uniref:phenylalanine--tRNA ligase subunit beta n=1 Tax=[Mycoplasma] cavipharyngis TaxID=92757 RepID=UPI003703F9D2
MLISRNLLGILNPEIKKFSFNQLENAFIKIGIEIEAFYSHQPIKEIYFGLIKKITPHPHSQKLSVCQVELSTGVIKTIICGASNVRVNLKVIVVLEGAILPNGLKITPRQILDIWSEGMICSYQELSGIDKTVLSNAKDNNDGIIELDDDFDYQQPFDPSVIGLDDLVFDLSIPANRSDLYCAFGLIVELSQKLNWSFKIIDYDQLVNQINHLSLTNDLKVFNDQQTNDAAFFIKINQVKIASSSWKIKKLLLNNNLSPINDLVDLGNLLVLLFNQPIHFHDANKIINQTLKISFANNQKFTDLNNREYQLSTEEIIISDDHNQVLALGGMIGSNISKITNSTTTAYLELINFNSLAILKTNNKYQINSTSTLSNIKVKSNYLSLLALNYMIEVLGTKYCLELGFAQYQKPKRSILNFDLNWLQNFIGYQFSPNDVLNQLIKLGYEWKNDQLITPIWRNDLITMNDLAEDIVNLLDINTIPFDPPTLKLINNLDVDQFELWNQVRNYWISKNFFEAKTYNLQRNDEVKKFNFMKIPVYQQLKNFNNANRTTLRVHGLCQLIEVINQNIAKQNAYRSWFELTNIFYDQKSRLSLNVIAIPNNIKSALNQTQLSHDFYDLKIYLSETLKFYHQKIRFVHQSFNDVVNQVFVPEATNAIINEDDEIIGYVGQLNFLFLKDLKWNLKQICYGAFVWLDLKTPKIINANSFSEYPSSFRQFSFTINKDQTVLLNDLIEKIKSIEYVAETTLLEKYIDQNNDINYLLSIRLNSLNETLNHQIIEKKVKAIEAIFNSYQLKIR